MIAPVFPNFPVYNDTFLEAQVLPNLAQYTKDNKLSSESYESYVFH